jgi:hypothetical protein
MASLAELARLRTDLDGPKLAHLQRLVGAWGLLADFCFADLLLFAPERGASGDSFVVLGQIRPATTQTVYRSDWVGTVQSSTERPIVANSFRLGEIVETETTIPPLKERIRVLAIPVRWEGEIIGVLTRESALAFGRQPGELERTYVEIFNRFARMISAGAFPFSTEAPAGAMGKVQLTCVSTWATPRRSAGPRSSPERAAASFASDSFVCPPTSAAMDPE